MMDDREQIREVYRAYWRYMIEKNADGLRGIMTEDYYLLHMTGVKQSAEVFLKGLLDGTFNYFSAEHDDIEVTVDGDRAKMTGKSRVLAAVYGGGKHIQEDDDMEYIVLNDGNKIPAIGFGVFTIPNDGPTYEAVTQALKAGYRHIDTAAAYFNEEDVGRAVRDSGIPRDEIFITSKLWLQDHGYEAAKKGIARSLRKLDLGYIDLYLVHQPYGDVAGAWKAMEEAKAEGTLRSIGVSNMSPAIWKKFVPDFATKPAVNQVEFNPLFQQKEIRALMAETDTKLEAWYPLGHGNAGLLGNPVITKLAEKYGKNAGQIILRFEVQEGVITLPKSTNPERIRTNLEVFDFELTEEEMKEMRALDTGKGSHDPDAPGVEEMLRGAFVIED